MGRCATMPRATWQATMLRAAPVRWCHYAEGHHDKATMQRACHGRATCHYAEGSCEINTSVSLCRGPLKHPAHHYAEGD